MTRKIKDIPHKLSKDDLKNYVSFDERFELAKLTYKISIYTDGILTLDKTLMGLIEIDPREILVDGIRTELIKAISEALHHTFTFKNKGDFHEMASKIDILKSKFSGMKKAFEYIQDFLNIQGDKIWTEEITRIFKANLDREAMIFVKRKYKDDFDNPGFEIPQYEPTGNDPSPTFLGRVLNQLLMITSVDKCFYLDTQLNFYDFDGS